jgi:DDE family transposase
VPGDSHGACPREAGAARGDDGCKRNRIGYIFGLAGNPVLLRHVGAAAGDAALGRRDGEGEKVRRCAAFRYAAKRWTVESRVIARVEAGPQEADRRCIVINLPGLPKSLYRKVYCATGQAENLIKAHKLHLAYDRTSGHNATPTSPGS